MVTIFGMISRRTCLISAIRWRSTELQSFQVADPLADPRSVEEEYGVTQSVIEDLSRLDALIMAVACDTYVEGAARGYGGRCDGFDVKMKLDRGSKPSGIELRRL